MTDWLVYRCESCHRTTYVNVRSADEAVELCCSDAVLVDVADHHQFCSALRRVAQS